MATDDENPNQNVDDANQTLPYSDVADGDVLNSESSDNISIQVLAEAVRDQLAPELAIEYEADREAGAEHTHASVAKAGETIGYEPSRTITEGSVSSSSGTRCWLGSLEDWETSAGNPWTAMEKSYDGGYGYSAR